jgi:hypothetical protein
MNMKKINLSVNLEDNEVFEKTIKEAVASHAKQLAREELEKELVAEIERIATARLNEIKQSSYYSIVVSRVTDAVVQKLTKDIHFDNEKVNAMIEEKVGAYLDSRIQSRNGLDGFIQNYIDKSIANALLQKVKD